MIKSLLRICVLSVLAVIMNALPGFCQGFAYNGMVGKAKAKFKFEFVAGSNKTDKVEGTYYLINKPRKVYQLYGTLKKRQMLLDEYTPGQGANALTAKLRLSGDWMEGFIGKMVNEFDNREFYVVVYSLSE